MDWSKERRFCRTCCGLLVIGMSRMTTRDTMRMISLMYFMQNARFEQQCPRPTRLTSPDVWAAREFLWP